MARIGSHFLALLPSESIRSAIGEQLVRTGVAARLGAELIPLANLHQTLSVVEHGLSLDALKQAGARVHSPAFTVIWNRVRFENGQVSLRALGKPPGFFHLLDDIHERLRDFGHEPPHGHLPHFTLCYDFAAPAKTVPIDPIVWNVDRLHLVEVRNPPYRYDSVASWLLRESTASVVTQAALF